MACSSDGTVLDLAIRQNLALPDCRGTTLRVTRGSVWITQENDTQDIVLRAGDTWVVERNGLTILEAQQDATVCVLGRVPVAWANSRATGTGTATPWRHVREAAATFFSGPPRRSVPYV